MCECVCASQHGYHIAALKVGNDLSGSGTGKGFLVLKNKSMGLRKLYNQAES